MVAPFVPGYFHWWHLPVIFVSGLIGEGFGALVGGGSIITMPALLLVGVPLQAAIATDNAGSLATETGILSETWHQVARRKWLALLMAVPMTAGGVLGTWLLLTVSVTAIRYVMAVAVIIVLLHTFLAKGKPEPKKVPKSDYALLIGFLFLTGIYANFITAGEGTFSRMALVSLIGLSFVQSQGLKSVATMPARFYSLVVTGFVGLIVWPYLLTYWCSNFLAGKYSTRFIKKVPDAHMKVLLTIISVAFVIYLLVFY